MIRYEELKKFISENTGLCYSNSGRNQMTCSCPWCEPFSGKNHGHLYIYFNEGNYIPTIWCFKCGETGDGKGTIYKLITKLGGRKEDFFSEDFIKNNRIKSIRWDANTEFRGDGFAYNCRIGEDIGSDRFKLKKLYLKSRLSPEYDLFAIPNLVLDIAGFVSENRIELSAKDRRLLDYYNGNFVGFVSNLGTTLVLRNINVSSDYRYEKLILSTKSLYYKDFYGIVTKNPFMFKTNYVVLCEGIFDLLVSMDYDEPILNDIKNKACMWASCLGNNLYNVIESCLSYLKTPSINVILLSDSNIKWTRSKINKFLSNPSVRSLSIYYNKFGKDFGETPIYPVKFESKI